MFLRLSVGKFSLPGFTTMITSKTVTEGLTRPRNVSSQRTQPIFQVLMNAVNPVLNVSMKLVINRRRMEITVRRIINRKLRRTTVTLNGRTEISRIGNILRTKITSMMIPKIMTTNLNNLRLINNRTGRRRVIITRRLSGFRVHPV